jgi:hypothetical protein
VQNRIQRDDDDAVKRVLLLFKVRVIYIYDAQVSQVPGGVERSFFKNVLSFSLSLSLYFLSSHASRGLRLGREDRL